MTCKISELDISERLKVVLINHGVVYLDEILDWTDNDFMKVRNIGRYNIEEGKRLINHYKQMH